MSSGRPTCSGCWFSEGGCGDLGCGGGILDALHSALGADVVLLLVALESDCHVPGIGLGLELRLLEPLDEMYVVIFSLNGGEQNLLLIFLCFDKESISLSELELRTGKLHLGAGLPHLIHHRAVRVAAVLIILLGSVVETVSGLDNNNVIVRFTPRADKI